MILTTIIFVHVGTNFVVIPIENIVANAIAEPNIAVIGGGHLAQSDEDHIAIRVALGQIWWEGIMSSIANMNEKVEPAAKSYARLKPMRRTGDEHFYQHNPAQLLDLSLIDFWRWAASDLVSNATRGILAEYIVAYALGLADGVRAEWDAYDLRLPTKSKPEGIKIEVKSASYLQSWFHKKLSVISFNINRTHIWDADMSTIATELKRQADIYVFCLLGHKEKETLDPLNLSQWEFYVLPTTVLNEKAPTQKKIGLASLLRLNPTKANYGQLAECIQKAAS